MTTNTMQKAAGASNANGPHTTTNGVDFRTDGGIDQPPTAVCIATRRSDGTWGLMVKDCPFCGKTHYHGGGNGDLPVMGHRVAHCPSSGYVLVDGGTICK
jgi:hypothetical protein